MNDENTSRPTAATNKYFFSTPAVWSIQGGQFWGTLGLTAAGRLEFTLKDGKLVFSAPLASIKYRFLTSQVVLPIVIGPRTYTVQFFTYTLPWLRRFASFRRYSASRAGSPSIKAWEKTLKEFTPPPADTAPIVAAHLPRYLAPIARLGSQGAAFFVCYTVVMGIAVLVEGGLSQTGVRPPRFIDWTVAASIVAWLIGGNIWAIRRYKKVTTTPLPTPTPDDLKTLPEDTLPAGTPPTGVLGISTGVAVLLGFLLVGAIFGLPQLVILLVKASGH